MQKLRVRKIKQSNCTGSKRKIWFSEQGVSEAKPLILGLHLLAPPLMYYCKDFPHQKSDKH